MKKKSAVLSRADYRMAEDQPANLLFLGAVMLLCLAKHWLTCRLSLEVRDYGTDDRLMAEMAAGILDGQWLGPYSAVNLMKGSAYPLFLAAVRFTGLSYLRTLNLINSAACLFFVWQVRNLIRDRRLLLVLFAVLLFDPCTFSQFVFQRVYRSSITWPQILVIFGAYLGIYFRMLARREKGNWDKGLIGDFLTAAAGAAALAFMWNTREESFWILPFLVTASALIFAVPVCAFRRKEAGVKSLLFGAICLLLFPAAIVSANAGVKALNRHYYGEAVRLEEVDGTFGDALRTIYSVKNRKELPYVTVSREKLERLYRVSPSLESIRPELEDRLAYYDAIDRGGKDGETEDGWFFWALRRAAFNAGKTVTLPQSQLFWKQVQEEIQTALEDPESGLERQPVLPAALLSPFRTVYLQELPSTFVKAAGYMISYQEVAPLWGPSGKESSDALQLFERVTGNWAAVEDPQGKVPAQAVWIDGLLQVYRLLNPVASLAAAICILLLLVRSFLDRSTEHIPCLLTVSGLLLSAVVLLLGVCYTEITAFTAISYFYLSGAYPLMLGGSWIAILYFARCQLSGKRASLAKEYASW